MVITYHGDGCFRIQSGGLTLLVDPLNARMKPDILLKTLTAWPPKAEEEAADATTASGGVPPAAVIFGPGEYERKGVHIWGYQVPEESSEKFVKTMYLVEMEELWLVFAGHLSSVPKPEALKDLDEEVDILFLPASGKPFLAPEAAAKFVKLVEPKIVIPSFVKSPKEFGKELGQSAEPEDKLTLKKKDVPPRGPKLVVLKES